MSEHEVNTVIQRFLEAIEAGNEQVLHEVYSDDIQIWHNFTNAVISKSAGIDLLMGLYRDGLRLRYRHEEQLVSGDRGVRRHLVEVARPDGQRFAIHVAMFATVKEGRITRLDEYVDSKELQPLAAGVAGLVSGLAG